MKVNFLDVLIENYEAAKKLTEEDKARSAQDILLETYEDLIDIYRTNFMSCEEDNNICSATNTNRR